MNIRVLSGALRRHSWLALAVLVVEFIAIVIGLRLAPRAYTAVAAVTAIPQASLLTSSGNFDNLETTLAQIVDSRSVLEEVRGRIANVRSVNQLRTEVSGARVTGTVLIRVTVVDANPRIAAEVANAVVDVLPLHDPSGGLFRFVNIDQAQPPASYSSPNVKIVLLVGIVLGVVLAVGAAQIRDHATRTVESEEQLRDASGTDVLGVVLTPRNPSMFSPPDRPAQHAAAFRAVRVALEFANSEEPIRIVVIASAVLGDHCGWLAVNLAVALARVGHDVLVIDCDGRGRHPALDVPGTAGLYDVLLGTTPLDRALVLGPIDRVTILPSGVTDESTDESLLEVCLPPLIVELGDRFDLVLVIARSPSESEDARVLAMGGSLLLAVPSHRVRPNELRRLVEELRAVQTRVVGTVLTRPRRRLRGYR